MRNYLVVCKDNFDIVGEYHFKKAALKNRLFNCEVYTRRQYEKAKKIEVSNCPLCGKKYFPVSDLLEDAVCDNCRYTKIYKY